MSRFSFRSGYRRNTSANSGLAAGPNAASIDFPHERTVLALIHPYLEDLVSEIGGLYASDFLVPESL
jgi:hypothetical protein